jgi:acetyltransferase-like isoleucine patch superfamily enzyme
VGIWTHTSVKQALAGHSLSNKSMREKAPVTIKSNVYIGGHTIVYPGVTIDDHAVVLPNSVVNKDVPAWTMAGGVPARIIRGIDKGFFEKTKDNAPDPLTELEVPMRSAGQKTL